jgi:hypothetical protein
VIAYSTLSGNTELEAGAVLDINNGQGLALTGNPTITNNGLILLHSTGSITRLGLNLGNTTATFTGSGALVLSGYPGNQLNADIGANIINDVDHTIRGGGAVSAALLNNGRLIADDQTLLLGYPITGNGSIWVADGAALDLRQNVETGNFYMRQEANLLVAGGHTVDSNGNFAFAQTDDARWGWANTCALKMSGEGEAWQSLEVAGQDLGSVAGGFVSNFDLAKLTIEGTDTYVYLADSIDNGNRSSDEAFYVNVLEVNPGATLNLNGLKLYTNSNVPHLVIAGDSFGGGTIIDEPSSVLPPDIQVEPSPPDFDFGEVGIGESSGIEQVMIRNAGQGAILISDLSFTGDDDFRFEEGFCLTTILGAGEQCEVTVQFLPRAVGSRSAAVTIQNNDAEDPEIVISLSGKGVCRGDFDGDGDVDGLDLATFADNPGGLDPAVFAANLGQTGCNDV